MDLAWSARRKLALAVAAGSILLGGAGAALLGACGPFTDVNDVQFCPFVLEIFYLGITTGTTPTTYDPSGTVSRLQMAAFLSRTVDRSLQRIGRRAALNQFWKGRGALDIPSLGQTALSSPNRVKSDGTDLWVSSFSGNKVQRVRGSDGKLLETWTGAASPQGLLVAMGRVFAAGIDGQLYRIDPAQPAGAVTTVSTALGGFVSELAFDGARVWSENDFSISIVTPGASLPWTVTTTTTGISQLAAIVFDGSNIWVADRGPGAILKLAPDAAILQTVTLGSSPDGLLFDGANIWVSRDNDSVSVVRASNGAVLATLTGNGLDGPKGLAFDGERLLVINRVGSSVSLWKADDLTTIGSFSTAPGQPSSVTSDGVNFWIVLDNTGALLRF